MISVIASISVKEGKLSEFLEIFKANVQNVKAESGCIEYRPTVDINSGLPPQNLDTNIVTIIEKWEALEDLHNHIKTPHMQTYREKAQCMVDSMSLKVLQDA